MRRMKVTSKEKKRHLDIKHVFLVNNYSLNQKDGHVLPSTDRMSLPKPIFRIKIDLRCHATNIQDQRPELTIGNDGGNMEFIYMGVGGRKRRSHG